MRELLVNSGKECPSLVVKGWDGSQIPSDSVYFSGYLLSKGLYRVPFLEVMEGSGLTLHPIAFLFPGQGGPV